MSPVSNSLISDYAARHGIEPSGRSDGRLTIIVDDKYRVHLQAGLHGAVVLMARLGVMPESGTGRDDWLREAGKLALAGLSSHAAGCVVDPRENALWLQQVLPAARPQPLDEAVGAFANALSFWAGAMRRLA